MQPYAQRILAVVSLALATAACSSAPNEVPTVTVPPTAGIYKIGQPYEIDGTWYYPHEDPTYDETGIASWYGHAFHGKRTANGEVFDSGALTAAHRTLPMPVNVRVTNLDNGKSIILRVNDRGPYAKGRIIDVSQHAAELLGFYGIGTAKVRVTYVSRATLPGGTTLPPDTPLAVATALPAVPTPAVQEASLAPVPDAPVETAPPPPPAAVAELAPPPAAINTQPTGIVQQVPVPAATNIYVQAGAFGIYSNALRLKEHFAGGGDLVISPIDRKGQRLYRVRIGPFDDVGEADAALAKLQGMGDSDAKIVVDQ